MIFRVFKVCVGFLVISMILLSGSLYISSRYMQGQQQMAASGDIPGAVRSAGAAARFDPYSPEPMVAQSSLFQALGRNDDSEDSLKKAIRRDPNNYMYYLSLGNLQMSMGKFQDAEDSYRRTLRLNPKADSATNGLAQSLIRRNKLEEAKKQYEKLYEAKNISSGSLFDLGRIYVRTGEPEKGFKAINQSRNRAERELPNLDGDVKAQQEQLIQSMKLAAADALVVEGEYNRAYRLVSRSESDQAPALLQLISTDPEGYRESVINSDIY